VCASSYEITNLESLEWPVRLYKVVRADGSGQPHGARGEIKQAIWTLRKKHSSFSPRYGFVVDVDEETVAVPAGWELPSGEQIGDYRVTFGQTVTMNPATPAHRSIISGILREAMKVLKHAEEWRLLRHHEGVMNPMVAQCIPPFDEENVALVCTTGAPYLSQGTASPLKICTIDIHGHASLEEVGHDLIWEADMCFTKLDTGRSLP